MLTYAFLLAAAAAGYANAPEWLVLPAALCLAMKEWPPWQWRRAGRIDWSSKTISYLVSGAVADLVLTILAFGAGRIVRMLLA